MTQKLEEWRFMQMRAAQLFEQGDVKGALRLCRSINREQARRFAQSRPNMNETKTVSTLSQ